MRRHCLTKLEDHTDELRRNVAYRLSRAPHFFGGRPLDFAMLGRGGWWLCRSARPCPIQHPNNCLTCGLPRRPRFYAFLLGRWRSTAFMALGQPIEKSGVRFSTWLMNWSVGSRPVADDPQARGRADACGHDSLDSSRAKVGAGFKCFQHVCEQVRFPGGINSRNGPSRH